MIVIPSTIIGGLLIIRGASFIRNDLSLVVAELREEMDEHRRQQESPTEIPALQVADIDFSYGHVQVLFDVGFEVRRGEVLALLGTNGAGKSTILRVIAGLGTPARGVVRLNGRTITYTTPEQRAKLGIRILLGGKGVFPAMTVHENLEMAAFVYRGDGADFRASPRPRATSCSPRSPTDDATAASQLSGGQQQMLALAMTLLHDPEVLAIDELSLGLAPLVVQELLGVHRAAQGRRDDDHPRRAVAERRAVGRRPRRVPREGAGALRGSRRGARRTRRPRARRVPRAGRRLIVPVVATWVTSQLVFNGLIAGLGDRSPGHGDRA